MVFFFWCLGFDRSAESYKIGFLFLFWAVPLSLSSLLAAVSFFYVSVFFRFRFPAGHLAQAPGFWIRLHSSVIASSTRPSLAASSAPGLRPGHPPLALAWTLLFSHLVLQTAGGSVSIFLSREVDYGVC